MKYLLIVSFWLCTSFATICLHSSSTLTNLNQEDRLSSWSQINPNSLSPIQMFCSLLQGVAVQNSMYCRLLNFQGIDNEIPRQLQIHLPKITVTINFESSMDSGLFEVWDEVADDAIEFLEEKHLTMDCTLIEGKTDFTHFLVHGIPDIPPEHIL